MSKNQEIKPGTRVWWAENTGIVIRLGRSPEPTGLDFAVVRTPEGRTLNVNLVEIFSWSN